MIKRVMPFAAVFCFALLGPLHSAEGDESSRKEDSYSLALDRDFTMPTGAENILTLYRGYQKLDDMTIESFLKEKKGWGGACARFLKTLALDYPVAHLGMVTQHEVFGHGGRLREHGVHPDYKIDLPPPYGEGGGATSWMVFETMHLKPMERIAVDAGGVESNQVMAHQIGLRAVQRGAIDYREGLLYVLSQHDQTQYIRGIRSAREGSRGHDIANYVNRVNALYDEEVIPYGSLRNRSLINLVDPMTFCSLLGLWDYWSEAETLREIPMIEVGDFRILPGLRLTLAPYGTEYGLNSYVWVQDKLIDTYLRYGNTAGERSYAVGVECQDIWHDGEYTLGGELDLWNQPDLTRGHVNEFTSQSGGSLSMRLSYQMTDFYSVFAEMGGKSRGYVVGEPLDRYLNLKFGIMLLDF